MWFSRSGYTGLDQLDAQHDRIIHDNKIEQYSSHPPGRGILGRVFAIAGWLLSAVLVIILALQDSRLAKRHDCFVQTSAYSPLLSYVPHHFLEIKTNGSLDFPSTFRGAPSPELDETWDSVSIFRPLDIELSEEQFLKFGTSLDTAVHNEPEYGGGFFVQPEFSHQLHCVVSNDDAPAPSYFGFREGNRSKMNQNLLRKASYFNYEYYQNVTFDFKGNHKDSIRTHIDHCIEILRQFVMCHADVGLVATHWIEGIDHPWPDFNTKKVCRDFDGILKWSLEHQAPPGTPAIPVKPAGAKALAVPP